MTLGEVKTQFVNLMNRTDLRANTALVSTFVTQAILRIQRELRVPMMEKTVAYTIPPTYVPTTGIAIPSDFLELIGIFVGVDGEQELQRTQTSTVKKLARYPGVPKFFTRLGANWIVGPAPAETDVVRMQYYASFPALATDAASNALTVVAWDAVVYAALAGACDYYNDERLKKFEDRYSQITQNLQAMGDGDELTADAAVRPVYEWPED